MFTNRWPPQENGAASFTRVLGSVRTLPSLRANPLRIVSELLDLARHRLAKLGGWAFWVIRRKPASGMEQQLESLKLLPRQHLELARGCGVSGDQRAQGVKPLSTLENPVLEGFAEGVGCVFDHVSSHVDAA